jgi:hypothetical protein
VNAGSGKAAAMQALVSTTMRSVPWSKVAGVERDESRWNGSRLRLRLVGVEEPVWFGQQMSVVDQEQVVERVQAMLRT